MLMFARIHQELGQVTSLIMTQVEQSNGTSFRYLAVTWSDHCAALTV